MTRIGKYELFERVGGGGYGEVYRARNALGVTVAIKLLRHALAESPVNVDRFQSEARLAMTLRHPNIVPVLDYDEANGEHFIVMDYLEGQWLDQVLADGKPIPGERALAILRDLAAGLDFAHKKGVLHRDLKPKNVVLLKEDGRAVIIDFGLARTLEAGGVDTSTGGIGRGTAGYMAPEQIRRQALSAQTDLYALGVVAYRLLVGKLPFEGDEFDVMEGHIRGAPPEAHRVNVRLPGSVSAVLAKALAKKPEERYKSAEALVAALAEALKPQPAPAPRVEVVAPPKPAAPTLPTRIRPKDGMVEVYIPAGEFLMGSEDGGKNEKPQHKVYLDAYWIDQTPVTNAMFARFVTQTSYRTQAEEDGSSFITDIPKKQYGAVIKGANWRHPSGPGSTIRLLETHPVVLVSWKDALAYCDWVGARLPTEAQWEKAARGTDGRMYPWGNREPDATLVKFSEHVGNTTPVGSYPGGASPYGVLDMAGNVLEWCADWYGETFYKGSPLRNPTGPASGEFRAVRGTFSIESKHVRAVSRGGNYPNSRYNNLGFRCARLAS